MEFARRGRPAESVVDDDDRRCPDDPALLQGDAMLVIRDALLSQLQKDGLRRKIIMAEVDKIERAVALRSDTVNGEQAKLVSSSGEEFIQHRMHEGSIVSESRTPAMEDRICRRSCSSDGKECMENAAYDEEKLQGSNESIQGEKASSSEKWELTGITMPVKKPKPPQKWSCSICQVETPSQSHLQEHFAGKRHQSNVATFKSETTTTKPSFSANQKTYSVKWSCSSCQVEAPSEHHLQEHFAGKKHRANLSSLESRANVISPKEETTIKPSFDVKQKTCSVKWSCSTCQVETPSERHLQEHFVGKKHRANVSTLESRGNVTSPKAETKTKVSSDEIQKTYSVKLSCSTCQVETPSERHLQEHFAGKKHRLYVSTLESRDKVVRWKAETTTEPSVGTNQKTYSVKWSCNACEVETPSQRHLQEHLSGKKHQAYVSTLEAKENGIHKKMEKTIETSSGANHKTLSLKWSCSVCQVETPSERHLQEHCAGKKHQSNVGMSKNIKSHEAKWRKCNVPQHPQMPPLVWRESDLANHLLARFQTTPEESKVIGKNFGLQKSNLYSSNVSHLHEADSKSNRSNSQADYDCKLDLDKNIRAKKHQLNVEAPYEEVNHEKDILPPIAKNQQPSSNCDFSNHQGKCNLERAEQQSLRKAEHASGLHSADLGGANTLESNQIDVFSLIHGVSTVLVVMSSLYFLASTSL